ncbi:MAG: hypothetical protein WC544_02965 [Patescibacteria group bacterium]
MGGEIFSPPLNLLSLDKKIIPMNKIIRILSALFVICFSAVAVGIFVYFSFFLTTQKSIPVNANLVFSASLQKNITDSNMTDIVLQMKNGETRILVSYPNIYFDHYHAIEYHAGNIYIIKRINNKGTNSDWTDELWKIDLNKHETKMFSAQGLDFRTSPDGGKIIVIKQNQGVDELVLIDGSGSLFKVFSIDELTIDPKATTTYPLSWSSDSKYYWGGIIHSLSNNVFKISTNDFFVSKYQFKGDLLNHDVTFNADASSIVYSDYPVFYDADEASAFSISGIKVTLYLENFITETIKTINTSVAKYFQPQWISETEIQYVDPNTGSKKIYNTEA